MRRRSRSRRKKIRRSRSKKRQRSLRGGDISRKAMLKSYITPTSQMTYNFEYYYDIANQLIYTLFTEWKSIPAQRRKRDLQSINILADDLEYLVTTRREKDLYDTIQRQVAILNKYSKVVK